jgi:pimeloyl-ACP methyl ester carboxylesterase
MLPPAIDARRETLKFRAPGSAPSTFSYYVDSGAGRRPLVLLHGVHAAASAFEVKPFFDRYRADRTVIAADLPGFGTSAREDVAYSPELYRKALVSLLEREAPGGADVIALGASSEFAAAVARDEGRLVRSLTMISPTGLGSAPPEEPSSVFDVLQRWVEFPLLGQRAFDLLVSRVGMRAWLGDWFHGEVDEDLFQYGYRSAHCYGARFAPGAFYAGRLSAPDAVSDLYEKLTVPTFILYDRGLCSDFSRLPALLEKNAHVRAARIAGSGAYPHFEKPEQTFLLLERTWQKASSRRPARHLHAVWC